jgi:hypothetical protein
MEQIIMKNFIIVALVALMLVASTTAQLLPLPISGRISNEGSLEGIQVDIKNLNTGEAITVFTNGNGEYLFDWSNSVQKWQTGNDFTITVGGIIKTVKFTGMPIEADFDLHGIVCPVCVECHCGSCNECPACETCPSCSECPACPGITCPEPTVCPTPPACPECEDTPECPTPDSFWMTAYLLLSGIAGALVGGAGVKFVLRKDAKGNLALQVTQHKHDGHTDYHGINVVHKTYWHPPGTVNPIYDKDGKFIGGK